MLTMLAMGLRQVSPERSSCSRCWRWAFDRFRLRAADAHDAGGGRSSGFA